jgi:sulfatase modifying factor 1
MRMPVRNFLVAVVMLALCAAALSVADTMWAKKRVTPTEAGAVNANPRDGLKYAWVPSGTFMMGCSPGDSECVDDEKPAHQVTITKGFWIGQTLVTVLAYIRHTQATEKPMPVEPFLMGRPLNPGWKEEAQPIVDVNWYEARDYCAWERGRLPSDAEWEYAARGGNPNARYGPLDDIAWYADNSAPQRLDSTALKNEDKAKYGGGRKIFNQALHDNGNLAHDVGLKAPNGFGLYDMLGNVWVWVNDWYEPNYYQHSPSQDPPGPANGQFKLERAASWDDVPQYLRASFNHKTKPELRDYTLGFRCVWEAPKP